jgi:general secretion pathway protein L
MLRDFLLWWARQLLALLPHRLLQDVALTDALVVSVDGTRDAPIMQIALRRRRREILLGRFRVDEAGQRAARAAIRQRSRHVVLRPDPSTVLQRNVVLPLAAGREIARVLGYEMDRLTPFTAEEVFWSATVEHRDRAGGRLELRLSLVPKAMLRPVLAAIDGMGLALSAIEAMNSDGTKRQIDLRTASPRRRSSVAVAWGAAGALALVAIATPFVTQSLARSSIETRIGALQPQVAQVEALRRRLAAGSAGNDVIAAERARIGDTLQVLATVTDLMPDDTVLTNLSLRQGNLSISGRSLAAPRLITAMAADPTIRNPSFAAPMTRTPDGKADAFVIRAELNP